MSYRILILTCLVFGSWATTAGAEDYLLRLDAVGYVDRPAEEKDPEETTIRSFEVIARPNQPFHGKVRLGKETLTLSGKLEPSDDGDFRLAVQTRYTRDTGETVLTRENHRGPVFHASGINTNIEIALGKPFTTGELRSAGGTREQPLRSRIRYVLLLSEYEPTDE